MRGSIVLGGLICFGAWLAFTLHSAGPLLAAAPSPNTAAPSASATAPPSTAPAPPSTATAPPASITAAPPAAIITPAAAPVDSFVAERDSLMNEVLKRIAGRENAPAESVFRNIKLLKGVPAGRVPRIMNLGYGRSLGVRCAFCHVAGHWADDDKPQKQITRDMAAMVKAINTDFLPKIEHLQGKPPLVNCTTCHRGSIKPALDMPAH
jgi:hypothetical protein